MSGSMKNMEITSASGISFTAANISTVVAAIKIPRRACETRERFFSRRIEFKKNGSMIIVWIRNLVHAICPAEISVDINFAMASMAGKTRNAITTRLTAEVWLKNLKLLKYDIRRILTIIQELNKVLCLFMLTLE